MHSDLTFLWYIVLGLLFSGHSVCLCALGRVKELGPGNAADGKAADSAAAGGAALSAQKSDLALLRNANVSICHFVSRTYCSHFSQIMSVLNVIIANCHQTV